MTTATQTRIRNPHLERASLMRAIVSPARSVSVFDAPPSAFNAQTDFYEGLPHEYPLLYVEEAAQQLSCSEHHVRDLIDEGALLAFPINEAAEAKRKRNIYRVVRATCVLWSPSPLAGEGSGVRGGSHRLTASGAHDVIRTVNQWLMPASIGSRSVLTVFETAIALRCTGQHVRKLYDAQQLRAVDISSPKVGSGPTRPGSPRGPLHLRIARESLVAFVTVRLARQNNIQL